MGINSYGLFNNGQSGSPYSGRNYELQRQLEKRQQQLGEIDRMPSLSAAKVESANTPAKDTASYNAVGRRDTEDGIMIPKNRMEVAKAYSSMDPAAKRRPNPGYAQNEYTNSGNITYKNPQRYDGSATTPGDTYLKGFFVDIKL